MISDELLDEMFKGDEAPKPAIYGGIIPTKEIIDFMLIPAGFRTFSKMRTIDEEVRAEECATHERWRVMSNSDSTPDQMRDERDRENRERLICTEERIDFSKIRATDLTQNKDIIMPGPVEIAEEVKIQTQKECHMSVIRNYMNSNCDKDGNIRESENMTKSELQGPKTDKVWHLQ